MSSGDSWLLTNEPKNQRIPSLLSIDRMESSGKAAVTSHESSINASWATRSTKTIYPNLFLISVEIVDIDNTQF